MERVSVSPCRFNVGIGLASILPAERVAMSASMRYRKVFKKV